MQKEVLTNEQALQNHYEVVESLNGQMGRKFWGPAFAGWKKRIFFCSIIFYFGFLFFLIIFLLVRSETCPNLLCL